MGIQINGQTDSITASDGSLSISGMELSDVTNINASGIGTFNSINATSIVGVSTIGVTTAYVTNINDGPISGTRNRIINGDMRIDQRNAGVSTTASAGALAYITDRTFVYPVGANVTVQRVAGTNTGTPYSLRLTGASGNTQTNIGQRIENLNVLDLNSKKVTVSCIIYASTSVSNVSITLFYCSSDNSGYGTTSDSQSITVSSGINNISKTFTLPATASRGFEAAVVFASGIGSGVTVEVTNLQLEEGPVATPFERRSYSQEFALCARYYENITASGAIPLRFGNDGMCISSTVALFQVGGFYPKRVVPAATLSSPGTFGVVNSAGGLIVATNASIINYGGHNVSMTLTVASGLTAGNATQLYSVAGQTPKIQLSSEL